MSSSSSTSKSYNMFATLLLASMAALVVVSGFQFEVGGEGMGWKKPTGKEPQTYNEWAARNRFHIGDTVYFKYRDDSVLVVSPADYLNCNTSNPISEFDDGNTVFRFDRPGFFYFISGKHGNCRAGERIIIRVMHPSEVIESPESAPSPAPASGGDGTGEEWGPPGVSSTVKLCVVSYVVTAVVALSVVVYLFV